MVAARDGRFSAAGPGPRGAPGPPRGRPCDDLPLARDLRIARARGAGPPAQRRARLRCLRARPSPPRGVRALRPQPGSRRPRHHARSPASWSSSGRATSSTRTASSSSDSAPTVAPRRPARPDASLTPTGASEVPRNEIRSETESETCLGSWRRLDLLVAACGAAADAGAQRSAAATHRSPGPLPRLGRRAQRRRAPASPRSSLAVPSPVDAGPPIPVLGTENFYADLLDADRRRHASPPRACSTTRTPTRTPSRRARRPRPPSPTRGSSSSTASATTTSCSTCSAPRRTRAGW